MSIQRTDPVNGSSVVTLVDDTAEAAKPFSVSLSDPAKEASTTSHVRNSEDQPAQAADAEPPSEKQVAPGSNYTSFTTNQKKFIVIGAAVGAFISPLSAQTYFPALDAIARDLSVSVNEVNLTVTTYMIVQAIAPMFVGSLADTAGRRPAYILCFVIYIAACIGCALAPNYAALLALRALQSAGSSATISLCQAVVSDVVTSAERGSYVGYTYLPNVLGPSVGPVLGGVISQFLGWRWIFWVLTIFAGVVLVLHLLFMPETCRLIVGDGSIIPHPFYQPFWRLGKSAYRKKIVSQDAEERHIQSVTTKPASEQKLRVQRPNLAKTLLILFEKEMFILLLYNGLINAGFFSIATAIPTQFAAGYGFDGLKIGLVYVPLGVGSIVSVLIVGKFANINYRRHCKRLGLPYDRNRQQDMSNFPIEQIRLEVALPFLALFTAVLIGWGWAIQARAHIAVEIILLFLAGISLAGFINPLGTLVVDINPGGAGAATAAINLTRGLIGAAASAFINPLIMAVGSGLAFTILALANIVFSPALWLIMKKGVEWRKEKNSKAERKKQLGKEFELTDRAEVVKTPNKEGS